MPAFSGRLAHFAIGVSNKTQLLNNLNSKGLAAFLFYNRFAANQLTLPTFYETYHYFMYTRSFRQLSWH